MYLLTPADVVLIPRQMKWVCKESGLRARKIRENTGEVCSFIVVTLKPY